MSVQKLPEPLAHWRVIADALGESRQAITHEVVANMRFTQGNSRVSAVPLVRCAGHREQFARNFHLGAIGTLRQSGYAFPVDIPAFESHSSVCAGRIFTQNRLER